MCFACRRLSICVDTYDQQYWQTVGTLPLLNRINEIHSTELNSIKITRPDITFPELHNEVFPKWSRLTGRPQAAEFYVNSMPLE